MAETHLQINPNGSIEEKKTQLWPGTKNEQKEVIKSLFEQNGWTVTHINNENGSFWKIITQCETKTWKINLYISTIRDESRQPDEFKMQLGTTYPKDSETGWTTIVLGIYTLNNENRQYILSGYDSSRYSFSSNPSIRGTRTAGLQKAWLNGLYKTEKSILFRPDFIYYYLENLNTLNDNQIVNGQINNKTSSFNTLDVSTNTINNLTAIRTKPFLLLAGISGTGKSRIVRKLAQATITKELHQIYNKDYDSSDFNKDRWSLHNPANFSIIQVKPNWHNSMDIVGYLSNIPKPHYVFTPFVEFIIKAWQHPTIPFFLCLDEMNLAPVEEYFAEFLSAIESRSFENGEYITDPIIKPFNSYGEEVAKAMVNDLFPEFKAGDTESPQVQIISHFRTKGLTLPQNLIVIGTVNMDETTFSFSRKVLDRAMSVEMNEVNYDSFLEDTTDDDIKKLVEAFEQKKYGDNVELNHLLVNRHIEAKEVIKDLGEDGAFVINYLKLINNLLEGTPFKLGYRAANEALIYIRSAQEFGNLDKTAALDSFTFMKILSRIEGDENKLKITESEADKERINKSEVDVESAKKFGDLNVLTALRYIIVRQLGEYYEKQVSSEDSHQTSETDVLEITSEETPQTITDTCSNKLKSIKKIDDMLSQLKRDHFVSFWN